MSRILLLAAALAATLAAGEAAALTLKRPVVAAGEVVRFGDFFEEAGEHAEAALFRAPAPGDRGTVSTDRLRAALNGLGVSWLPPAGLTQVEVMRLRAEPVAGVRRVAKAEVERALRAALAAALPDVESIEDLEIASTEGDAPLLPPEVDPPRLEVVSLDVDPQRRRFAASIALAGGSGEPHPVSGRYWRYTRVPVLAETVERGEIVRHDQLAAERMRDPAAGAILDFSGIVGQAAKRRLPAGATVSANDLEAPLLVSRNQLVTMVFDVPGMVLTTQGRALADGALGDTVAILNIRSNRIIQGLVRAEGLVGVGPAATQLTMR